MVSGWARRLGNLETKSLTIAVKQVFGNKFLLEFHKTFVWNSHNCAGQFIYVQKFGFVEF